MSGLSEGPEEGSRPEFIGLTLAALQSSLESPASSIVCHDYCPSAATKLVTRDCHARMLRRKVFLELDAR